jgi:hypothetical protein
MEWVIWLMKEDLWTGEAKLSKYHLWNPETHTTACGHVKRSVDVEEPVDDEAKCQICAKVEAKLSQPVQ